MNPIARKVLALLPDKLYLDLQFYKSWHRFPNWNNPITFGEKIQWLKLYDRKPEYVSLVDKYTVKQIVADKIGAEHIIPTLGVWENAEDIEWDNLPDRFVLKTTHGGGNNGIIICIDKSTFNKESAIKKLSEGLKHDSYAYGREWPYKYVKRRIIAEQYINPTPGLKDLTDYKWYCFNGEPKYCQVIQGRTTNETIDFYDVEWKHQDFIGLASKVVNAQKRHDKPSKLDSHLRIARELSRGIPFSRIDLYETSENTYFGEVTLYPASGLGSFRPDQYNVIIGRMINLPGEKQVGGAIINVFDNGEINIELLDLKDYMFFCFNGFVNCFMIDFDRNVNHRADHVSLTPNFYHLMN